MKRLHQGVTDSRGPILCQKSCSDYEALPPYSVFFATHSVWGLSRVVRVMMACLADFLSESRCFLSYKNRIKNDIPCSHRTGFQHRRAGGVCAVFGPCSRRSLVPALSHRQDKAVITHKLQPMDLWQRGQTRLWRRNEDDCALWR